MNDMQNIPLNQLCAWKGNVRKTPNKGFIDELAASIKAHGLQQNLIVRKEGKKFAVIAGGQRLKALLQLAKSGEIKSGHLVACRIADADSEPLNSALPRTSCGRICTPPTSLRLSKVWLIREYPFPISPCVSGKRKPM